MNLTDKDIDKLFRDAANSAPKVEFKDAYWDEMNAFLDQEEKSKRGIYSMLSIGILALIGVGSLLLIPNQNKYNVDVLANRVNSFTQGPKETLAMNANTKATNVSQVNTQTSPAVITSKETQVVSTPTANKEVKTKNATSSISSSVSTTDVTASNQANGKSDNVQNSIQRLSTLKTLKTVNNNSNSETEANTVLAATEAKEAPAKNFIATNRTNLLSAIGNNVGQLPFSAASKPNLGSDANTIGDLAKIKSLIRLKDRLYVELGVGLMDNYNDAIAGRSYTYSGALNYEFRKDWFRLRTGVGVSMATNVNLTYTTSAKIYDFGSRNSSNELIYKDLYDVYVPIELGASFKKVSFGLGYKYNFLNHSRAEFRTFNDGALKEEGVYYGLTEGLKQNTSSAYFFIERNLFGNVDLGIKMGTYLNSRAALTEMFDMVGQDMNPKYGFVYLKYNFRK